MSPRLHPSAIVEREVAVGDGSAVWDNVHIRSGAVIGRDCIIGEKTYVAPDVRIDDRVKVNAFVYLCTGVTLETGVMVAAGVVFTNDRFPRATTPDLAALRGSEPDERTLPTLVREGATIGARSVIGCGLEIGRFAMVGMGSVVTRDVPDFHLALGNPAVSVGIVCRCGERIHRFAAAEPPTVDLACGPCGRTYRLERRQVSETTRAARAPALTAAESLA